MLQLAAWVFPQGSEVSVLMLLKPSSTRPQGRNSARERELMVLMYETVASDSMTPVSGLVLVVAPMLAVVDTGSEAQGPVQVLEVGVEAELLRMTWRGCEVE